MSATFYDLQKYAKTGIASPDMAQYDRMKASAFFGGSYPIATITDAPPIHFKSDGTALTAWSISGNMVQTGTPTPDAPIVPQECGDRTANLFDMSNVIYGTWTTSGGVVQEQEYGARSQNIIASNITVSFTGELLPYSYSIIWLDEYLNFISRVHISYGTVGRAKAFNKETGAKYFYIQLSNGTNNDRPITQEYISGIGGMINTGSTVLPYEPYGYKIPITLAGQTQTVYLSEPLRKALDGSDAVDILRSDGTLTREVDSDGNALQTPTTETVTVPTLTPTEGNNVLSFGTTLQPSEVSITGHIKQ